MFFDIGGKVLNSKDAILHFLVYEADEKSLADALGMDVTLVSVSKKVALHESLGTMKASESNTTHDNITREEHLNEHLIHREQRLCEKDKPKIEEILKNNSKRRQEPSAQYPQSHPINAPNNFLDRMLSRD